jgi:gliding motility-associated protein GldE
MMEEESTVSFAIKLVLLFVLLGLSAFFSGSETAMISLGKTKIRVLADKGIKGAETVQKLMEDPDRLLSTILIGNNFVNVAASVLATLLAIEYFGSKGPGIATGVMTLLILTFGEILPKTSAIRRSERFSMIVAKPIDLLASALKPILILITWMTKKLSGESFWGSVTEEEIETLLDVGEEEGVLDRDEREMIHHVLELDKTTVKGIMTHRTDMICLDVDRDVKGCLDLVTSCGYSRIPVFDKKMDNIVGILYAKDLLKVNPDGGTLRDIMRPPFFVPETKRVDELLTEFQKGKVHIAIVVDEYGGTAGLATIEDVMEEIVGSIFDEYDVDEDLNLIKGVDENTFIVDGRTDIDELAEVVGLDLEGNFETVGGFLLNLFNRFPEQGEKIDFDGYEIVVEKIDRRRIRKIKIRKKG